MSRRIRKNIKSKILTFKNWFAKIKSEARADNKNLGGFKMANIRLWSPMDHLFRDFADMTRMLDMPNVPVLFKGGEPKVDIIQNEMDVVVKADVPGVRKEDINVTVTEDTITIRGETKSDFDLHESKSDLFNLKRLHMQPKK